jgi:hypothetical protein
MGALVLDLAPTLVLALAPVAVLARAVLRDPVAVAQTAAPASAPEMVAQTAALATSIFRRLPRAPAGSTRVRHPSGA